MKTATITWISYNNYGTFLQAYALQQYIKKLGHKNELVSDGFQIKPQKAKKYEVSFKFSKRLFTIVKNNFPNLFAIAKKTYSLLCDFLYEKHQIKRKNVFYNSQIKFYSFKKKELNVTSHYDFSNYTEINSDYDIVLCGSDQIWSVFDFNFNGFYFLDFVTIPKISYGTSIGTDNIPADKAEIIKNWLSDYKAISVREKQTSLNLSKLSDKYVEWVCDPTLLFDKTFWSKFAKTNIISKKRYLLCYFLEDKPWYFDYAKEVAEQKHLQLLLIPSNPSFWDKENYITKAVGPKEYVALIKNADYVITDSYHGMLFSLNFKKQFAYLLRFNDSDELCQNIRIYSIIEYLDLWHTIQREDSHSMPTEVKYESIDPLIEKLRTKSQQYLKDNL